MDENRFAVIFGYSRALSENTTFVADLLYSEQEQEEVEWVVLEVGLITKSTSTGAFPANALHAPAPLFRHD